MALIYKASASIKFEVTMLKIIFRIAMATLLVTNLALAQRIRTEAMGGLKYSVLDKDLSLSPFDFGGNPAWMFVDESETFLRITPSYGNTWGNYQRKFDPEGELNLGASFHGVKKLGEKGTFSGFTSYDYQNRRNNYQTLMKDTYSGEGFRLTDGTKSDFRYMGPRVVLMYSLEPVKDLYTGGSVTYHLLDGLKEKFSYAKTIFRDTEINLGLAYRISDTFVFGANVTYFDSQEAIESEDVNLLDVELYYYRGDEYFVSKRSQSMTGKIRKQGITLSSQLFWDDGERFSFGSQINYTPSNSKILKPYTSTSQTSATQSFDEVEDSYTDFTFLDVQCKTQYKISDEIIFGAYAGYINNKSWSKISLKELLMWEWKTNEKVLGLGASYQITEPLLLAFEYEFSNSSADSSKFIDNRMNEVTTNDHELRIGAEYKLTDEVLFRGGVKFGTKQYDLVFGGNNCKYYRISGGLSFPLFETLTIETNLQYSRIDTGNTNFSKNYLFGSVGLTLNTF